MGTTNLRNGMDGDEVRTLQDGLRRLGYQVEVDGKFGPNTEDAVKSLQMLFGYTVDGIAGEGTQSLVQQQIGYGWNLNLPNAKELAMGSQNGGQMGAKGGAQPMGGKPMQQGMDPMQGQGMDQKQQGQAMPEGKPVRVDQPHGQPMQGKPMQQGQPMQGKPMQGQPMDQGKPMQQGQPMQGKPMQGGGKPQQGGGKPQQSKNNMSNGASPKK